MFHFSECIILLSQIVKRLLAYRRPGFDPCVRKLPWRRKWQPTPVFLPGKSHGQRSLMGYSPWGCKESDTTEWLRFHPLTWFPWFFTIVWSSYHCRCISQRSPSIHCPSAFSVLPRHQGPSHRRNFAFAVSYPSTPQYHPYIGGSLSLKSLFNIILWSSLPWPPWLYKPIPMSHSLVPHLVLLSLRNIWKDLAHLFVNVQFTFSIMKALWEPGVLSYSFLQPSTETASGTEQRSTNICWTNGWMKG